MYSVFCNIGENLCCSVRTCPRRRYSRPGRVARVSETLASCDVTAPLHKRRRRNPGEHRTPVKRRLRTSLRDRHIKKKKTTTKWSHPTIAVRMSGKRGLTFFLEERRIKEEKNGILKTIDNMLFRNEAGTFWH